MWHLIKLLTFDAVDLQQNKCKSPLPHLVSQLVCVCLPLPVVSVKCKAPASRETGCVFSSDNLRLVLPFVQVWRRLPILSHSSITTLRKDFVWKPGAAKKKRTNKYKYFNKEEKEDLLNRILETLRQKCEIIEMWNCQVKMITYKIQIMRNKWKIYISCRGKGVQIVRQEARVPFFEHLFKVEPSFSFQHKVSESESELLFNAKWMYAYVEFPVFCRCDTILEVLKRYNKNMKNINRQWPRLCKGRSRCWCRLVTKTNI